MTWLISWLVSWFRTIWMDIFYYILNPVFTYIISALLQLLVLIFSLFIWVVNVFILAFVIAVDATIGLLNTTLSAFCSATGINNGSAFQAIDNAFLAVANSQGVNSFLTFVISTFYTDVFKTQFLFSLKLLLVMLIIRFIARIIRG